MTDEEFEAEEEREAAAEAAQIGGHVSYESLSNDEEPISEADRALIEAGEGESEGFELSEAALEQNASHGDQHSAGRIIEDAALQDEDGEFDPETSGEADEEANADD
jgi:general stress protein YciG